MTSIVFGSVILKIIRTLRTKNDRDLSIAYLASLATGISMLMVYSIHIRDFVFILGNTLSMLSVGTLMALWRCYHYRRTTNGLYAGIKR